MDIRSLRGVDAIRAGTFAIATGASYLCESGPLLTCSFTRGLLTRILELLGLATGAGDSSGEDLETSGDAIALGSADDAGAEVLDPRLFQNASPMRPATAVETITELELRRNQRSAGLEAGGGLEIWAVGACEALTPALLVVGAFSALMSLFRNTAMLEMRSMRSYLSESFTKVAISREHPGQRSCSGGKLNGGSNVGSRPLSN